MRLFARPVAFGLGSLIIFAALLLLPPVRAAATSSNAVVITHSVTMRAR
jgi:uncharacterized membrane protein YfcA